MKFLCYIRLEIEALPRLGKGELRQGEGELRQGEAVRIGEGGLRLGEPRTSWQVMFSYNIVHGTGLVLGRAPCIKKTFSNFGKIIDLGK